MKLVPDKGMMVGPYAAKMCEAAREANETCTGTFEGIELEASPRSDSLDIVRIYVLKKHMRIENPTIKLP